MRLLLVASVLSACTSACTVNGGNSLKNGDIVRIVRGLGEKIAPVKGVKCKQLAATLNATTDCIIEYFDGPERTALVTVTDPSTGAVNANFVDSMVDRESLTKQIIDASRDNGLALDSVTCPSNKTQAIGETFTCQATQGDAMGTITVTGKGDTVDWSVTSEAIDTRKVVNDITAWAQEKAGPEVVVDCGGGIKLVDKNGAVKCSMVVKPGEPTLSVSVTLKDDKVLWEVES